jgi:hypothetical protein
VLTLYLDYQLDEDERLEVESAVGEPIQLTRVPWLFPLHDGGSPNGPIEPQAVLPHLERIGLQTLEAFERVLLVAPREVRWYASLAEAIHLLTGQYPLLIQPEDRRVELGCPGPLRIVDMEAYMKDEDQLQPPPWLVSDVSQENRIDRDPDA